MSRTSACAVLALLVSGMACSGKSVPPATVQPSAAPSASPSHAPSDAPTGGPTSTPVASPATTPGPTTSPDAGPSCDDLLAQLDGQIAFRLESGQAAGIAKVNADGTGFQEVVDPGEDRDQPHFGTEVPRWTSDGRIVFSSNRAGGPDDWHIFVVDGEVGEPVQLTSGADGIEYHGVMSPDGSSLVYAKAIATPEGPDPFGDAGIFISGTDGGDDRQLTTAPTGGIDEHPDMSPDGTRIAFSRSFGGPQGESRGSIYVVNTDGTGLQELTDPELDAIRPRWSSDGEWIAFSSNADNSNVESANVWLVSADERGLRQLTNESDGGHAYFPDWSTDDGHIVYLHHAAGRSTLDIDVTSRDGETSCTLWSGTSALAPGDPDWSPSEAVR